MNPANTSDHAQPQRDAAGRWRKGTPSPNPTGRPKVVAEVRDLARRHTRTCVARLLTLVRSGKGEVARAAACDLLAYGWGRPAQAILAAVAELPSADLDALRAQLARRVEGLALAQSVLSSHRVESPNQPEGEASSLSPPNASQAVPR